MTTYLGYGLAPLGTTPFGYGSVATADPRSGVALTKSDGTTGDTRFIDPVSQDYVMDSDTGRLLGQDAVQSQVYLALRTIKGTCVIKSFGQDFSSIQVISGNIQNDIKNSVRQALLSLINRNVIQLIDTVVEITPTKAIRVAVRWKDISKDVVITTIV